MTADVICLLIERQVAVLKPQGNLRGTRKQFPDNGVSIFKDGEPVQQIVGAMSKDQLLAKIKTKL